MSTPLRILMLEDSSRNAEIVERQLRQAKVPFTARRVSTENEFRTSLASDSCDLILANYEAPTFGGLSALRIVREAHPEVPFIFYGGSAGEECAIEALRQGATDYIFKDQGSQLPLAILRVESLVVSERRFQLAARATRDVIWELDVESQKIWVNEALASEWGYPLPQRLLDLSWWDGRLHPDDVERVRASRRRCVDAGEPRWTAEYRFRRGSGEYAYVRDHAVALCDADGSSVTLVGAMTDVTAHTRAVQDLAEAQRVAELGSWTWDLAKNAVQWSDETYRIFGLNPETTIPSEELFYARVHPDDRERVREVTGSPGRTESEFRIIRADGAVRIAYMRFGRVESDGGRVVRAVGTIQDVTQRKRLEQQLEQAERISTLGRVAATIAHEFNNVLMAIQPFAEIIRKSSEENPRVQHAAAQILNSVGRGRSVTQQILRVTRPAQALLETVDATTWLHDVANEIRLMVGPNITVAVNVPKDSLYFRCDPAQMQQAMTNLALNARDAMTHGGTLTFTAEAGVDSFVRLIVEDTGHGILPDVLPHIFEPLFTTKHSGTGLGLGVTQQVVTNNGGTIHVETTVGSGTRFLIELPAASRETSEPLAPPVTRQPPPLKRILLVEDDEGVSGGISSLLSIEGIDVRIVQRGAEAVPKIESYHPEAVILDLSLPDIDGLQVYRQIQERWPDLPVIFSSGHGDRELVDGLTSRHTVFLRKPYDLQSLMAKLHEVM
jgi:PAS domain S-box-containing protein